MKSGSIHHPHQRVGIFIDAQNLYHSAKNLYRGRVNYQELIKNLLHGRPLIRAFAYVVKSETAEGESAFFDALENAGIELCMKDIQIFPDGSKKADWDVGMAVDAVSMASRLDVVILVTGDGDFCPLVTYLHSAGCRVEVAAFDRSASQKIKEIADAFLPFEEMPRVIQRGRAR